MCDTVYADIAAVIVGRMLSSHIFATPNYCCTPRHWHSSSRAHPRPRPVFQATSLGLTCSSMAVSLSELCDACANLMIDLLQQAFTLILSAALPRRRAAGNVPSEVFHYFACRQTAAELGLRP